MVTLRKFESRMDSDDIARMRSALPVDSLALLAVPEELRPWLQLATSLTQKLGQAVGTKPGLILLGEGLEQGNAWESETSLAPPTESTLGILRLRSMITPWFWRARLPLREPA